MTPLFHAGVFQVPVDILHRLGAGSGLCFQLCYLALDLSLSLSLPGK